jgi:hypothetical protein
MADKQNIQPLLDAAQNQLSLTISASDSLDSKMLGVLGFDAALLIFALQSEGTATLFLLLPALLALLGSLVLSVVSIWPRTYKGASVDVALHREYLSMEQEQLALQLLSDTQDAIRLNNRINARRGRQCIAAIISSSIGILFLAGCIIKA